jgi:hypothetical protein
MCLLVLTLGLCAPCAGWLSSAEARLSCCTADGGCPMHPSESPGAGGRPRLSQADADSCCAASERTGVASIESSGSILTAAMAYGRDARGLETVPSPSSWERDVRPLEPAAPGPVPRHLLLSVFLV